MKKIGLILLLLLSFYSCEDISGTRPLETLKDDVVGDIGGGDGNGAVPGDGTVGQDQTEFIEAKVEIRHLIEPKVDDNSDGGAYKRKLTIPKNFDGHLYVAGINISTLSEKNLKVRFT